MNKVFSIKLYKEALRQLRTATLLFSAFIFSILAFYSFSTIAGAVTDYKYSQMQVIANPVDYSIILFFLFAVCIPVCFMILFGFLFKRNSSDFYHAIPNSRTCIFNSYLAAILTIVTVILVIATAIPVISFTFASKYIAFNSGAAICMSVNIFTCILLVAGAMCISVSLSGTQLVNVLLALVIILGPRLLFQFLTTIMVECIYFLPYGADYGFFSPDTNLVFSSIMNMLDLSSTPANMGILTSSTLYTLILGIIYIVLGLFAFNKRKSEYAETTGKNKLVQHFLRFSIGMVFCLIPLSSLLQYKTLGVKYSGDASNILVSVIAFSLVSIAAMVLYEIFTTRAIKSLLNVLYTIPVLFVCTVLCYFSLINSYDKIISYTPSDNLKTINYLPDSEDYYYYGSFFVSYGSGNYFSNRIKNIDIKNREFVDFVSDILVQQNKNYKEYMSSDTSVHYLEHFKRVYKKTHSVNIVFNEGLISKTRALYLSDEEYNKFNELVASNDEIISAYRDIPEHYDYVEHYDSIFDFFTEADVLNIYKEFRNEVKSMDANTIREVYSQENDYFLNFSPYIYNGASNYSLDIYIGENTPKTMAYVSKLLGNKSGTGTDKLLQALEKFEEYYNSDTDYVYIDMIIFDTETSQISLNLSLDSSLFQIMNTLGENDSNKHFKDFKDFQNYISMLVENNKNNKQGKYIVLFSGYSSSLETYDINDGSILSCLFCDITDEDLLRLQNLYGKTIYY